MSATDELESGDVVRVISTPAEGIVVVVPVTLLAPSVNDDGVPTMCPGCGGRAWNVRRGSIIVRNVCPERILGKIDSAP